MFSSSPYLASRMPSHRVYREVGARTAVDGASPHKLISLLYAGLAAQIANARGALGRRDVAEKGRAIGHAVRIVDEGLRAALDLQQGGAIASNLGDLYEYLVHRLTHANLKNDDAALRECARLVETLRDGWDAMPAAAPARTGIAA
jgi:flagellar secretion chaperone FliS